MATNTGKMKSRDNSIMMPGTVEPSVFRMPISRVRCNAMKGLSGKNVLHGFSIAATTRSSTHFRKISTALENFYAYIHSGPFAQIMHRTAISLFFYLALTACVLTGATQHCSGQTKFYISGGQSDIYYHNRAHTDEPSLRKLYYGLEVDRYLDYHYALTSGVFFLQGGYDNGSSRWTNQFIQVPVGIKIAPLGEILGISAGINFNGLLSSHLRELADTLGNYYSANVTSAMKKIQPDFFFGLLIRLNRVTLQMKFSYALTNRFSTGVKTITDPIPKYYGSYYTYVLGKEEHRLTESTSFLTLSVRLF
jgi:hypothetical protein